MQPWASLWVGLILPAAAGQVLISDLGGELERPVLWEGWWALLGFPGKEGTNVTLPRGPSGGVGG